MILVECFITNKECNSINFLPLLIHIYVIIKISIKNFDLWYKWDLPARNISHHLKNTGRVVHNKYTCQFGCTIWLRILHYFESWHALRIEEERRRRFVTRRRLWKSRNQKKDIRFGTVICVFLKIAHWMTMINL